MTEAAEKIDVVDTGQADKAVVDTAANENTDKAQDKAAVTDGAAADTGSVDAGAADKKADDGAEKGPTLPDNWREMVAGEDEDMLKLLKRYGSMAGVAKALRETQATLRSSKVQREMPDPKDEKAIAEWRKEQGIPEKPEGYKLPEPLTKRLVDDDKPILANFMERMHGKNWVPAQIQDTVEWYADFQEEIAAKIAAQDEQAKEAADDVLRQNWARDEYKPGLTLAKRFWEASGVEGLAEARLPDGRKLGNIAEFIMWSSDQGRERFGDVVFSSGDAETKHSSRKAEIEEIMKNDIDSYFAKGLDKEYAQIVERDEKRRK